jgi:hypothetical protein
LPVEFNEAKQLIYQEASGMTSETLGAEDIGTSGAGEGGSLHLIPYLIWREILLGASRRQVYMRAVEVSNDLIGVAGNKIYVPVLDRDEFTAQTASENDIDQNGFTKTKITPSEVEIYIGDVVYNATKISDILREDSPSLGWVRASLQKIGESVAYKVESDIESALYTGAVTGANVQAAATAGVLSYNDIVDVKTLLSEDSYYFKGQPFLLFINPEQEGDLIKELGPTAGTSYAQVRDMDRTRGAQPITSLFPVYANCIPMVTEVQRDSFAMVVIPPTHPNGPAAIFAWKRHMKAESWRDEDYGRDVWLLSCRYGVKAVETKGIGLISNC